jgi:hypothetical protein
MVARIRDFVVAVHAQRAGAARQSAKADFAWFQRRIHSLLDAAAFAPAIRGT